jgi:hypothetical protein
MAAKPRIRQNRYDNWYGYMGTRRVEAFGSTPTDSAEENAKAWLASVLRVEQAFANDAKRKHLFDENGRRKLLTLQDVLDESAEKFRKKDL